MAPRRASMSYLTDTLPAVVPPIFDQAQGSTANHRKNVAQLRKIHETCASITEETERGLRLIGERVFNTIFIGMVNRVLPVKKGVAVADRIAKFVASYVSYCTENDKGEEDGDSMSSRFVAKLLKHLIAGMEAKDKNVRFRVTLMASSLINGLGELEDDLYVALRQGLLDRARDKESAVRVQAALGLAKLGSSEDPADLEDGEESIIEVLYDLLQFDSAAEVRRAVLYNLPVTRHTLPLVLARSRDVDPILRRTVFHGSLSAANVQMANLSIADRETLVRNGLGDREPNVRKAAANMLGGWVDQAEGDLLAFLGRLDVVSSDIASEALNSVFVTRPEVLDSIQFDEEWWNTLTPEKAFLARVFAEHCVTTKDESRLEEAMPEVTALAFRIQAKYNDLTHAAPGESEAQELAFMVREMLRLALTLDYADEIGRRKMFELSRLMIAQMDLPEELIPPCMDVLAKISTGERDLIRLIVDIVTELRLGDGDVESETQSRPQDSPSRSMAREPETQELRPSVEEDLRCLYICICLLERVNTNLQDNSVFLGLLPDLIIPSVRSKDEPELRNQGLICLGLVSLIDANIASQSLGLFVQQLSVSDDDVKIKIVKIIFDLLMVHDISALVANTLPADRVVELVRHMVMQDAPAVQAAACEGVAKLMLAGMILDDTVLQSLVLLYFSPETADNQPLRQCLTYFMPVYCYSSATNQRHLLKIFADTFGMLSQLPEEFEDAADLLPLSQMGLMMVDWLDPHKVVGDAADPAVHLDLAIELLKLLLTETSRDVRKTVVGYLSKLNLPENTETDAWKPKAAHSLAVAVKEKRPLSDATSRNALGRFDTTLLKRFPELEGYDEDAFRTEGQENEETKELWGFIDDVDEGAESPDKTRRSSRATTSRSRSSAASDSDATPVKPKRRPAPVAEETEDEEVESMLEL